MASLPPIDLAIFETKIEGKPTGAHHASASDDSDSDSDSSSLSATSSSTSSASPFQCLFCTQSFGDDETGLAANLEHMRASHGLHIPDVSRIADMQSFIGYLATEVCAWHECLYCGATKPSTLGIQSHMRDKGHCALNLEREPELLEFWEDEDEDEDLDDEEGEEGVGKQKGKLKKERPTTLSATEMRFASGRVIGSKHAAREARKASRRRFAEAAQVKALTEGVEEDAEGSAEAPPVNPPLASSSRQLARREQMGIIGVSDQQRQALVLAEKKAQRTEAVARRAREWVYAKAANSQKFDQLDNQMKFGKQNHKLLPR